MHVTRREALATIATALASPALAPLAPGPAAPDYASLRPSPETAEPPPGQVYIECVMHYQRTRPFVTFYAE